MLMDILYDGVAESGEGALFVRTAIYSGAAPAIFVSRVYPKANIDMTQSVSIHSIEELKLFRAALDVVELHIESINHVPSEQSSQT